MRFLFVAYCISSSNGDSLIGVYKRALRIGLQLVERNHEVVIACPGRELYQDSFVDRATAKMMFLDLPLDVLFEPDIETKRAKYRAALEEFGIDVVVVGEAPLAGSLLDMTITAVQARIPVILVDNAYGDWWADGFCRDHGPMMDGIVLTGPRSFHTPRPIPYLDQLPPFVSRSAGSADGLLASLGVPDRPLVTVLGYETKAELLALSLLPQLPAPAPEMIILTRNESECRQRIGQLPEHLQRNVHVARPPEESVYFDLVERSRLTIGKCGFMQVTESLSLGTPFIGVYYRGCFDPSAFPRTVERFLHATNVPVADSATVEAAIRMLAIERSELSSVHDGSFDALERAADFVENMSTTPRRVTEFEWRNLGYPVGFAERVLDECLGGASFVIQDCRASRIRRLGDEWIDSLVFNFECAGELRSLALWTRFFKNTPRYEVELSKTRAGDSGRALAFCEPSRKIFVEYDRGEKLLPPVH